MWLITNVVLALLLVIGLGLSYKTGFLYNFLNVFVMLLATYNIAYLVYLLYTKQFGLNYWQQQISVNGFGYWFYCISSTVFFALIAYYVSKALPADQFSQKDFSVILGLMIGLPALIIAINWLPTARVNWPQSFVMAGFSVLLLKELLLYAKVEFPDAVTLANPFKQQAIVAQAGGSSLFNHHYHLESQRWAVDMVLAGKEFPEDGAISYDLNQYPCFGAPLYAPVDGKVVGIRNDLPDVAIGDSDTKNIAGNYVTIQTTSNQYVMLAHLKQSSVQVQLGQRVTKAETLLAECGNSGNTTEPHLHLQVQNHKDFEKVTQTFPIYFVQGDSTAKFARAQDRVPAK